MELTEQRRAAYSNWMLANVPADKGYGQCRTISQAMQQDFPELQLRKGTFDSLFWGLREHWWLQHPSGTIIDPTGRQHPDGSQFPAGAIAERYRDMTDWSDEQIAAAIPHPCANCGDDVYGQRTCCNDACERAMYSACY